MSRMSIRMIVSNNQAFVLLLDLLLQEMCNEPGLDGQTT